MSTAKHSLDDDTTEGVLPAKQSKVHDTVESHLHDLFDLEIKLYSEIKAQRNDPKPPDYYDRLYAQFQTRLSASSGGDNLAAAPNVGRITDTDSGKEGEEMTRTPVTALLTRQSPDASPPQHRDSHQADDSSGNELYAFLQPCWHSIFIGLNRADAPAVMTITKMMTNHPPMTMKRRKRTMTNVKSGIGLKPWMVLCTRGNPQPSRTEIAWLEPVSAN
jgi:hypothetical protein